MDILIACDSLIGELDSTIRARIEACYVEADRNPGKMSGNYLSQRMDDLGLGVTELSKMTGYSVNMIYRVKRGEKPMSIEFIKAVTQGTQITKSELAALSAVRCLMETFDD